jgi:WD40 repeat protein
LPQRYRLPLVLCCLEGLTQDEAARQLGWTPASVKGRLARGRVYLHDRLVRRGLSLPAALVALEAGRGAASAGFLTATTRAALACLVRAGSADAGLSRARTALVWLLLAGVVAGGVAAGIIQGPVPPQAAEERVAVAPAKARTDLCGDPLPAGALARLGTLRWRATGKIEDLAISPDGKTIITASFEGAAPYHGLCLLDAATGKRTRTINPPGTRFDRIALSSDGRRLACGCQVEEGKRVRRVVQILQWPGGKKVKEYPAEGVQWLGWSADAQPLGIFQAPGAAVLRELATGKERRFEAKDIRQSAFRDAFFCACTAGAKLLAAADQQGVVHVWDTSTGKKRCALQPKGIRVRGLALSPDGRLLATLASDTRTKTVQLWDVTTGKATHTLPADQPDLDAVAFTPDGKTLATLGWREVRFWDAGSGRQQGRARGMPSFFSTVVAFSPDSKTLIAAERWHRVVQRWDVPGGVRKPQPTGHSSEPYQVTFSPDGRRAATAWCYDGSILVWDSSTGEQLARVYRPNHGRGCAFSADGRVVMSCWDDDRLIFSDASNGRQLHVLTLADPDRPWFQQAGLYLAAPGDRKTVVAFSVPQPWSAGLPVADPLLVTGWDTTTRKQLFRRRRADAYMMMAVSGDLEWLAVSQEVRGKREVCIENLKTGESRLVLPPVQGWTMPLAFSPDGRLLATTGLRLWELATGREVLALPAEEITRAAFSPDGRLLALTAPSRQVIIYDLRRGQEVRRIKELEAEVTCLAFSPDGHRLLTGLSDSTALVWEGPWVKAEKVPPLDAEGLKRAWADLGAEPGKAFAARGRLAASPEQALPLLKERVQPVRAADSRLVRRLFADLDSDELAVRDNAQRELGDLGDRATAAMRQALGKKPSAEVKRRIETLLKRPGGPVVPAAVVRAVRAVAVLEDVGTAEARQLLEALAGGEPQATLTREAKAALRWLRRTEIPRRGRP